uniref:Solute carrier organic anion transporter family member n=1 Tax=Plectus sambesii TaxID=2011161 RepID=A0A914X4F9_9BILA
MSGLMISASDFGYIPTVAIISYMGSKGNRARWLGGGCLLIALSNFLIAMPNFVFVNDVPQLNTSIVREKLAPPAYLLRPNVTEEELLSYPPFKERVLDFARNYLKTNTHGIPDEKNLLNAIFGDILQEMNGAAANNLARFKRSEIEQKNESDANKGDVEHLADMIRQDLIEEANGTLFFNALKAYVRRRVSEDSSSDEVKNAKDAAFSPFGYCDAIVNELRQIIDNMKCERDHTNTGPFIIIFFALFILGIGRTMPWSLGVPLIDDNVKRKNMPVYFAGMFFIKILGPAAGFSIGSLCNRLYYTLKAPEGLSPRDPSWIGAWWLGFLIIAAALVGPALVMFFFPHSNKLESDESKDNSGEATKKSKRNLKLVDRHISKSENGVAVVPLGVKEKVADFKTSVVEILKSPIYSGSLVGRALDVFAFKGFMVFMPKYLENHFGIPQYKVQIYLGSVGVGSFAVGMLTGSFVMRKFKLEGRKAALYVAICSMLAVFLSCGKIFLGCHSVVNSVGLKGQATNYNYNTECNADCSCDSVSLFPVCDIAGNPYFSPCHAGCRNSNVTDLKQRVMHFTDCKCTEEGTVVNRDWCKDDCDTMAVAYFALAAIAKIVGGMGVIPGVLIMLRSVAPKHRSISLGLSGFLVSLFATLPSPLVWGLLIDGACLVWDKTCSGAQGACSIYEPNTLRISMHVFYAILRCIALLSDLWVLYFAKDLKLVSKDESRETNGKEKVEMN